MKRIYLLTCTLVTLVGCAGPDNGSGSDWELSEDEQANNGENNGENNVANNGENNVVNNGENNVVNNGENNIVNNGENNVVNNSENNVVNNTTSCLPAPPDRHRPAPSECEQGRPPGNPPPDDAPFAECMTDDDCTDGLNGRCGGNGHDGWYCTYDECHADDECATGSVCECGGGFRSDHNICLAGNCNTDADCETGFCSPSQGDCGAYFGTVGYFCHTCEDECVNDSDCGNDGSDPWGPYCMYDSGVGHWRCSESQCVG